DEVERSIADDLVGDVDPAAAGVPRLRTVVHPAILSTSRSQASRAACQATPRGIDPLGRHPGAVEFSCVNYGETGRPGGLQEFFDRVALRLQLVGRCVDSLA